MELKEFREDIRERVTLVLVATKPVRWIWTGLAVSTFVLGVFIVLIGFLKDDFRIQLLGWFINAIIVVPVRQLGAIKRDVTGLILLPARLEVRFTKCGWESETREEYKECLSSVMDEVDQLLRQWSEDGPSRPT